jgi:DNA-binding transcriptional LysR family regulator
MEMREMRSPALLAECGSIQEAAERAHLTPAQHLKTLEHEFGLPLYEKFEGHLRLTEGGNMLLPFVAEILAQYAAAFTSMQDWKSGRSGLVRVGAGPSFSTYLLPGLIKRFRRSHHGIDPGWRRQCKLTWTSSTSGRKWSCAATARNRSKPCCVRV